MADNVEVTAGSGTPIATDDVSGAHYQRVKVDLGADGATSPLVRGQQTAANSLPVTLPSDQGTLTISGTVTANLAAGTNNVGDVDVLSVPAPLSTTGGGTEATALRVTLASDSTGLISVDDNAGSLTVDGTVTANLAAGTNNIGDVDVLTVPAPLNLTGGGVEASALRVTLANDSTGVLSVDDNGGALTVDGTVTANLAAGTNNIGDVDVLTVPAPLNLTGGGVEASALRVTLANDSTGVLSVDDNGSSLTVDGTVAVTNADLSTIAGAIKTEDLGHSSGDTGVMLLAVRNDAGTVLAGTTGDYIPLHTNSSGNLRVNALGAVAEDSALAGNPIPIAIKAQTVGTPPTAMSTDGDTVVPWGTLNGALVTHHGHILKSVTGTVSATTTIVSAVASKKIKVYAISLISASTTSNTITLKDGAAGTAKFTVPLQAISGTIVGIAHSVTPPGSLFEGSTNTLLELAVSAAQNVTYNIAYWEEA